MKKYSTIIKDENGVERVVANGFLTLSVPALAKSKSGRWVLPILKTDEQGNLNNWFSKDGKPIELYSLKDGKEEIWQQPKLDGRTREKALYLLVPKGDGRNEFYKLEAWNNFAKHIHMSLQKGDEVMIVAKKKEGKSPATSKDETVWVLEFIKKFEKYNAKNEKDIREIDEIEKVEKSEKEEEEEVEINGFRVYHDNNDDDDVPF